MSFHSPPTLHHLPPPLNIWRRRPHPLPAPPFPCLFISYPDDDTVFRRAPPALAAASARRCSMIQLCAADPSLTLAMLPQPNGRLAAGNTRWICRHVTQARAEKKEKKMHTHTRARSGKGYNAARNKGADGRRRCSANCWQRCLKCAFPLCAAAPRECCSELFPTCVCSV